MPQNYTVSVPPMTTVKVGETVTIPVSVSGPGPLTLNKPYKADDRIKLWFAVNTKIVEVVSIKLAQTFPHTGPLDHTVFVAGWTMNPAEKTTDRKTFVGDVYFGEGPGDPNQIEHPFDLQMGPVFEIEVKGLSVGQTQLDVVSARLGETDQSTAPRDGNIRVVAA